MLNFNVCVCVEGGAGGGGRGAAGYFYAVVLLSGRTIRVLNAIFFEFKSLTPNHFLAKQTELGRIFSYSILKVILCTGRRTQLQQKIEMSVSFGFLS